MTPSPADLPQPAQEPATEAQLLTIEGPRPLGDEPSEEESMNSAAERGSIAGDGVLRTIRAQLQHSPTLPRGPLFARVTTVFLSSLTSPANFRDLTLISEAIPQLQRLQISAVSPEDDIATIPEGLFPSLEWLSLGGFRREGEGSDMWGERPLALTNLLQVVSERSGMQHLRRLDLFFDIRIPAAFLNTHAPNLETLSALSSSHTCIQSVFERFNSLALLVVIIDSTMTALPRAHSTLKRIAFYAPQAPRGGDSMEEIALMNELGVSAIILRRYASLQEVTLCYSSDAPPHWISKQVNRVRSLGLACTLIRV